MRRTITVYETVDVDVDIDIEEYKDDFLEICTDEEILSEANKRKLILQKSFEDKMNSAGEFRRYLCDLLELGYYASEEEILNNIKSRL